MMNPSELAKAAEEQGWTVSRTNRGHWRFVPPDPTKQICIGSGTASDFRSTRNLLAQMKRQGFVWPWPPKKGR